MNPVAPVRATSGCAAAPVDGTVTSGLPQEATLQHSVAFHPIFSVGALRPYTNRSRREQSCGAKDVTINAAVLDAHISARTESRVGWCIACLASAGILLLPAIWNGFPLLEYDT